MDKIIGKGEFVFKRFENCDPPVSEIDLSITPRKLNRTFSVLDLTLSSPWPISDDIILEINAAAKKDGGYKPGVFYFKGPFCETLQKVCGQLFDAIVEATGEENCPIPGTAQLIGFYADSEKLNDQMLFGDYRAELNFIIKDVARGCYMMYFHLVPVEE